MKPTWYSVNAFTVAALIVSGKTHQLPNKMVLMATFDLTLSNTSPDSRADSRESELQTPTKEAIPKAENKGGRSEIYF